MGVQVSCDRISQSCHGKDPPDSVPPVKPAYTLANCEPACAASHLKFLNSGFIMGTYAHVKVLAKFLKNRMSAMPRQHNESSRDHESNTPLTLQRYVMQYASSHPDRVVYDYKAELVMNMHQLDHSKILEYRNSSVLNKWMDGQEVCFMHFNGDSQKYQREIVAKMDASQRSAMEEKVRVKE
jgi:hypothetical protein